MFSGSLLLVLLANLLYIVLGLAVAWLVIYTAVRAALSTHRRALAERPPAGGPDAS